MPIARTYDLEIVPCTVEEVVGEQYFTFGSARSQAVRGFTKLVCQWVRLFMTPKGSDPMDMNAGTDFTSLINSNVTDLGDIQDVLMTSIMDCNEQIMGQQQSKTLPSDEILLSATLTDIQPWGEDGFQAYILLQNVSGSNQMLQLPGVPLTEMA